MNPQRRVLHTAAIIFAVLASTPPSLAESLTAELPVASIDEYLDELALQEAGGGELYCEDAPGEKRQPFNSCDMFAILRKKGCYGYTTFEINSELKYAEACSIIKVLRTSDQAATHYFDLRSENWWRLLPAEVIPIPGGTYSDESWKIASEARDTLVAEKTLAEIPFAEINNEPGLLIATLATWQNDCGEIRDEFLLETTLLADFDGDKVAELMLQGYRAHQSDSCVLGSGNSMGATFTIVVKRDGPGAPILVSSLKKIR